MPPWEVKEIRSLLTPVFQKKGVERVVLFGSAARGSASRKSDLDLMIVMKTRKRFLDRFEDFEEIYWRMKGKSVDLLIYTPEELKRISHRKFIRTILDEGITIYECGKEPTGSRTVVPHG